MSDPFEQNTPGLTSGGENTLKITLPASPIPGNIVVKAIGCHTSGSLLVLQKNDTVKVNIFVSAGSWKIGRFVSIEAGTLGTTAADIYVTY